MKKKTDTKLISKLKTKIPYLACLCVCYVSILMCSLTAFAEGEEGNSSWGQKIIQGVASVKTVLFALIGGYGWIQFGYGIWLFANSFDSDDSNQQSKGVKKMIAGGIMGVAGTLAAIFI